MNKTNKKQNVDKELEQILSRRTEMSILKPLVVGTGITSSHLGDERNVRELFIANHVVSLLRSRNHPVIFYLFDDSFDPLDFRQLRVAVNKDPKLIAEFEKYCGMPLYMIPDPYTCHTSYSAHFQNEILKRFQSFEIYPNIIDVAGLYESGYYDFAKQIVFSRYREIQRFLKKHFPQYTMKKLFYPFCTKCQKLQTTEIMRINPKTVSVKCTECEHTFTEEWKKIKGKFSWKIDVAIKWNIFKVDFEPYSKAYLDPDLGSYFIAKKLSEEFFGGYYPEVLNYGQIIMDKSMSYRIIPSFPAFALHTFLTEKRKTDIELTEKKLVQFAHDYKINENLSYYDYVISKLPYDVFEKAQGKPIDKELEKFYETGIAFSKNFLNKDPLPALPTKELMKKISRSDLVRVRNILKWVLTYRTINSTDYEHKTFVEMLTTYMKESNYQRGKVFHTMRTVLSLEDSLPMSRVLLNASFTYLSGCLMVVMQHLVEEKTVKNHQLPSAVAQG